MKAGEILVNLCYRIDKNKYDKLNNAKYYDNK